MLLVDNLMLADESRPEQELVRLPAQDGGGMESLLPGFEANGARGFYRPGGRVSADLLADLMTAAIRFARAKELREVVVNITATSGFESPGPDYRRRLVKRWAGTAAGLMRVVVVAERKHICPHKTGLLVAAEEGLHAHICEAEAEAIAWLDAAVATDPTDSRPSN